MYEKGFSVKQNKSEAKKLYAKACDNGLQYACDMYKKLNEEG
jgi:TPR repeat protein